jgi:hypothetical protein
MPYQALIDPHFHTRAAKTRTPAISNELVRAPVSIPLAKAFVHRSNVESARIPEVVRRSLHRANCNSRDRLLQREIEDTLPDE